MRLALSRIRTPTAVGILALVLSKGGDFTKQHEGKRNAPYLDTGGVRTVCYGETSGITQKWYSDATCNAMFDKRYKGFVEYVWEHLDEAAQNSVGAYELAAHADLAYRIGKAGWLRSSAYSRLRAGDHTGACEVFLWYNKGRNKQGKLVVIKGIDNRAHDEYNLCMQDYPKE